MMLVKDTIGLYSGYKLFGFILFLNLVVVGVGASYLNIKPFYWLGSFSLLLAALILALQSGVRIKKGNLGFVIFPIWVFLVFLFGTNSLDLKIVAFKDYIIPSVVFFILAIIQVGKFNELAFYRQVRAISLVQLPFVLQQYFIQARSGVTDRGLDWDVISGTFGFNPNGGGGNSSTFVLFQMMVLVLITTRIKKRNYEFLDMLAVAAIAITLLLAETKVIVVLAAIALISVSKLKDLKSLKYLLTAVSVFFVVSITFLTVYQSKSFDGVDSGTSTEEYFEKVFTSYFENEVIDFETGEVGRTEALSIWVDDVYLDKGISDIYLGYGLTSSKYSNATVYNSVAYGTYINFASNQLATYLWDTGLVGVFLGFLFFLTMIKRLYSKKLAYRDIFVPFKLLAFSLVVYSFYSSVTHSSIMAHTLIAVFLILINSRRVENAL